MSKSVGKHHEGSVQCCFTSTETTRLTGDGHLDFDTAPELRRGTSYGNHFIHSCSRDNSCEALPVTTVGFLSCWLLMTNTLVITLDLFHYHCYDNSCEALPVTTVGFLSCWLLMTNTLVITLDLFHYHCYDNSCEALPVTIVGFLSCWLLMTNTLVITLDLFHYHCYLFAFLCVSEGRVLGTVMVSCFKLCMIITGSS